MRAVVLATHGGPECLEIREVPDPEPGPEEVLVDVEATALNRADLLQRMGLYPGPPMDHEIPGLEWSGRVAAAGERVTEASIGDAVMGIVSGGAHASRLVTHQRMLLAAPHNLGLADAAAIPEVFITAWDALVRQGAMTAGRTALVHAGASGVGTAAIQLMKAMGARILVTASGAKCDACRELGADVAIDYQSEDFVSVVADHTDGRGVDCVLDVIGGDYVDRNLNCLRTGGRVIQVGLMGGGAGPVNVGTLLVKRAALIGTTLRSRPLEDKIAVTRRFGDEVLPWFDTGVLRPVIDSRFPLDQIADAHRHMEANANVGKIVIDVV